MPDNPRALEPLDKQTIARRIAVLGSTGSIGCNTLEVITHLGPAYRVTAISGNQQIEKLAQQTRKFRPASIGISDETCLAKLNNLIHEVGCRAYVGDDGIAGHVQVGLGRADRPGGDLDAVEDEMRRVHEQDPVLAAGRLALAAVRDHDGVAAGRDGS